MGPNLRVWLCRPSQNGASAYLWCSWHVHDGWWPDDYVHVVPLEAAPGTALHEDLLASNLTFPRSPWKKHAWQDALDVRMTWNANACSEWKESALAGTASQSGGSCVCHLADELLVELPGTFGSLRHA